jgi:phosphoglycerol transferase MdoB-like AlkP superfamily enzyme
MFIFALVNRFRLACILVIIPLAVLSFSHWMKVAVRGVVVYPWDLALMGEGVQVLDLSPLIGWWPNLLLLFILVPFLIMAYGWLPKWRMKIWQRLCALGVFILFIASLFYPSYSVLRPFHNQILKGTWNQNIAYSRAGVFLAFAAEVQYFIVREPDGYSEEKVDAILAGLPEKTDSFDGIPDEPVNLILILSESFWDPTRLEGVQFKSDPIPTVHEIEKRFGSIECVTPVYGGGTCDSELEMLTGCSMVFFPPDTAPYKYYIRKPLPSIASVMGGLGYSTVTLAGSYESYFNDYQVYPRLGFDRFINAHDWTIDNITTRGWYIDDDSTMLQIIDTSRRLKKQGRPYLINVNTMENHWPYPHERYAGMDYADKLEMKAPQLEGTPLQILQTFVFGMKRSDAALKKLIEHYEKEKDPVMIIFYGDHLPGLGHGGNKDKVFRQCGFFPGNGDDLESCRLRLMRKYRVKVYFWNNFDYRPKLPEGPISMNYCPVFILRNIGIKPTPFFIFLEKVCREYPVINPHGCLDRADHFIYSSEARNRNIIREYEILQWDRVFGEGYFNNR